MNRSTFVGGVPTSETFVNTTDSIEAIADALGIVVGGAGGGFEADGTPSLYDRLIGDTDAVIERIGSDNANNSFASGTVISNRDGSTLERLEFLMAILGATSSTTTALGTTSTFIDSARTEAVDYWNSRVYFVQLSGTNVGLASRVVDFDDVTDTGTIDPALPNAIASGVTYVLIAAPGDNVPPANSTDNITFHDVIGSKIDTNAGDSILARQLVPAADSATNINTRDVVGNKTDTNAGNSILARQLVPAADSVVNVNIRDVVGNKTDTNAGNSLFARLLIPATDSATNISVRDVVGSKVDTNAGNSLLARNLVPTADSASNINIRDVVGNKTDTNAGNSLLARHLIPTADVTTNTNARDVIGNKSDAVQYDVATTRSIMGYLKAIKNEIKELKRQSQYPVLSEFWASDTTAIDLNIWATAVTGTSTVTRQVDTSSPMRARLLTSAGIGDDARLRTVVLFRASPTNYTTSFTQKRLSVAWEGRFTSVANFDNATFIMGLTSTTAATRATTNIIGFGLLTDALRQVTDNGGVESETVPSVVPTLTDWNEYRIEITRIGATNTVEFWINDTLTGTHNTAANIPDANMYLSFFVETDAAATAQLDVGAVTAWISDTDLGTYD